jgi:monofunctional biosynthetic peptidoglycan transglycosylase
MPTLRKVGKAVLAVFLLALAAIIFLQLWFLAHAIMWREVDPTSTRFMREQLSVLRERDPAAKLKHQWVPYERQSPHLKRAVIASEDARFPEHDGVDWEAIEQAFERNAKRGKTAFGGSTITMQLAKNLFLTGDRSYVRKVQELAIAYMLEAVMSKRRILEIYLNVAEWGVGVFGAEAAAQHHFGVSAARLTPMQAARLAAMLPRPRYYDQHRDSVPLARRTAIVQRRMIGVEVP